jgi:hypothetical protein
LPLDYEGDRIFAADGIAVQIKQGYFKNEKIDVREQFQIQKIVYVFLISKAKVVIVYFD